MVKLSFLIPLLLCLSACDFINNQINQRFPPADVTQVSIVSRTDDPNASTVTFKVDYIQKDIVNSSIASVVVSYRFDTGATGQESFLPIVDDNLSGFRTGDNVDGMGSGTVTLRFTWGSADSVEVNIGLTTTQVTGDGGSGIEEVVGAYGSSTVLRTP